MFYFEENITHYLILFQEEEVAWAGITCRTAHQLLRRQDSCQSLCSIHGGASNVVIEPTEHILETKEILIKPGENCIEMKLDVSVVLASM